MKTILSTALVALTLIFGFGETAYSGHERMVVINNVRLTPTQLASLDAMNCAEIPNGFYVLDLNTGAWAYASNPYVLMGYIGQSCQMPDQAPAPGRRESLSERGLLYSPGELLR